MGAFEVTPGYEHIPVPALADGVLASRMAEFGDLLRQYVARANMSPGRLAAKVSLHSRLVDEMFKGLSLPSRQMLTAIIHACDRDGDHPASYRRTAQAVRFAREAAGERLAELMQTHSGRASLHRLRDDAPGFELKPDPLGATTKEEFLAVMRLFHVWAGEPSYREIARNSGKTVGASTLCEALDEGKPPHLPTLKVVTAFIYGCGGSEDDLTTWTTAWRQVRMARAATNVTPLRTADRRNAG